MSLSSFTGESNALSNEATYYACAFPVMIKSWRTSFNATNAWFG